MSGGVDGKDEGKDAANQQAVESACKLILQQVLKSCPGANLSSITIKTTTQPVNAVDPSAQTTTTTTLQIKSSGSALTVVNDETGAPSESLKAAKDVVSNALPTVKTEFVKTPTALKSSAYPHFYHNNYQSNSKRNSSISSMNSLSSQSVVSALSTPSSEDIFTMRNLICMDEGDSEAPLTPIKPVAKKSLDAGTPVEMTNAIDNIMSLINMNKANTFNQAPNTAVTNEAALTTPLKRPSSISSKMSGNLLTTASLLQSAPLKASSPIQQQPGPLGAQPSVKNSLSKKLAASKSKETTDEKATKSSESRKRPAAKDDNEDTTNGDLDMSESEYDYSDDSSDSINGEIYRKSDSSSVEKKRRKNSDDANSSMSRSAPTLATGRRSKDTELPPDEAKKRQERRERNKEAAARCRRKREELTVTLTKKTELLSRERESLRQLAQDLAREKSRLESSFLVHEKSCAGKSLKAVTITVSPTTPSHKSSSSQNNLLRIRKEEINEIIKQSSERKHKQNPGATVPPTTPQLINSLVSASAAFPSNFTGGISSLLNTSQSEHNPFQQHHSAAAAASFSNSFTNAVLSNLNEATKNAQKQLQQQQQQQQQQQDGQQHSSLLSPSKYASGSHPSPATVAAINELLAAVSQHQQNYQAANTQAAMENFFDAAAKSKSASNQAGSNSSSSSSCNPLSSSSSSSSSSSIQRPSNLNLKSPQSTSKLQTSSSSSSSHSAAVSQSLVQELFASFNGTSATPLQLNTPIIFALTPLEATLNTLNAFAANCNTPVLSHQASTFLTPNSASLAQHTEQFNALNDAYMNNSSMFSSSSANNNYK